MLLYRSTILGWTGRKPRWQAIVRWKNAMPQFFVEHVQRIAEMDPRIEYASLASRRLRIGGARLCDHYTSFALGYNILPRRGYRQLSHYQGSSKYTMLAFPRITFTEKVVNSYTMHLVLQSSDQKSAKNRLKRILAIGELQGSVQMRSLNDWLARE